VLIRTDGAGASHAFLDWLHGQRLSYSIGFGLPDNTGTAPGSVDSLTCARAELRACEAFASQEDRPR
jgi:hypothetical protein